MGTEAVDSRGADAPCRQIDHTEKGFVVVGIAHKAQVRQHVLDFLAAVKRHAAIYFIWYAVSAAGFFQRTALRIGAIENSHFGIFHVLAEMQPLHFLQHEACLVLIGVCLDEFYFIALAGSGSVDLFENLLAVVAYHAVGGFHDGTG